MNRNKNSDEIAKRMRQQIREAKRGMGYYVAMFLLLFAIPLYILSTFLYASGWALSDTLFILIMLAIAISGVYKESTLKGKLPLFFTVLGVISGIVLTIVQVFFNMLTPHN
jgi:hypothetical protein